jgi:hypothetical protein
MSNSTVVPSSEYGVTQYQSLMMPAGSNGGIYNAGFVTGQNSAASQHALIQATTGGKKRRFKGGDGQIAVPAVSVAYADGGKTAELVAGMTSVSATQYAQAKYDSGVTKGGKRNKRSCKRSRRNKSCKKRKGSRKGNKSKRRISRRHR